MSKPVIAEHAVHEGSLRSYVIGFILSIAMTLAAYFVIVEDVLTRRWQLGIIFSLAIVQFMVQIFFFLHLGKETKPRWKQLAFLFMIAVVIIVVLGSIWIMANLNYSHDMSPTATDHEIIKDEGY